MSGNKQARRRSFTESNPPPRQNGIQSGENYCPPYKSVKTEGDAMKSGVPFSPTKLPYMKTGCGSTLLRDVEAFSGPTNTKDASSAKIEKDSTSCRAPHKVMKDVMVDPDWSDRVKEKLMKDLSIKAEPLKEFKPSCSCLGAGVPEPELCPFGPRENFQRYKKIIQG